MVFGKEEIQYLRSQKSSSGRQLFGDDFLHWLSNDFNAKSINLYAIAEGRVIHPNVPIHVVEGPLAVGQIIETGLLNIANYQTLIATKAARIKQSGRGQVLLEFGLRRAQSLGAIAGARAALIGGADFSSNVGASHIFGFTPKGTHAHSMVQVFLGMGEDELAAFRAYAEIYPDDCLLLVDTIDTLQSGVPNAIRAFEELKRKGHRPVGIRLDSGDLAHLSIQAAKMLNDAGFPDVSIVLSNDLDELVIWQIITQIQEEAEHYGVDPNHLLKRLTYGVGTHLITSTGNSALDGVFKLVAINQQGEWIPTLKISENEAKTLNPGNKRAWRIYDKRGKSTATWLLCMTKIFAINHLLNCTIPLWLPNAACLIGMKLIVLKDCWNRSSCPGAGSTRRPPSNTCGHCARLISIFLIWGAADHEPTYLSCFALQKLWDAKQSLIKSQGVEHSLRTPNTAIIIGSV